MHRVKVRCALSLLFALVLPAGAPSPVLGGGQSGKQEVTVKRGFHPDGRPWLWPEGTQLVTDQEARGNFAVVLEGKVVLAWTLDRGVAELVAASGKSWLDQQRGTSQIKARLLYESGESKELPTRVVLQQLPGPEPRATDEMLVEALVPIDSRIARIQLIDHQGVVAWDAMVLPSLLQAHPTQVVPSAGADYQPIPMNLSSADQPQTTGTSPLSRSKQRRLVQQKHIQRGLYPPFE